MMGAEEQARPGYAGALEPFDESSARGIVVREERILHHAGAVDTRHFR